MTPPSRDEQETWAPSTEKKANTVNRIIGSIWNGMKDIWKWLFGVVKEVAKIPVHVIKTADHIVSHIPIAGEVYWAGKEVVKGVWWMTEQLPVAGAVFKGLREGARKVANAVGFTDQDLWKILQLQEWLIITPEKLEEMLKDPNISADKKDILETALLTYKTQIEQWIPVSQEDLYKLQESIRSAAQSWNNISEKGDAPSWAPSLQSLSFSENPISEQQYARLTTPSQEFPQPAYEALNDQQKKLLDFCREKIYTDGGSPTQDQKELMSAMAYVSEVFETGKEGDMQKMVDRMRAVKTRYWSTFPASFSTFFEEALVKWEKSLSTPARGGH